MTIHEAVDAYILQMRKDGKASSTQYDCRLDLRRSARFLEGLGITTPQAITPEAVDQLVKSWGKAAPRSRSRYSVSMRGFLSYLFRQGAVDKEAYKAVPPVTINPVAYSVPAQVDLRRLIETAPAGSRERALMELLALGINPAECCVLKLADYDQAEGALMVGVGTRRRRVELPTTAWATLTAYIEGERTKRVTPASEGAMFLNLYGRAISRMVPWNTLRYACEQTGMAVTARMLRAARVASMLKNNMDPGDVAKAVGLTCVDSALRYKTAVTEEGAA